MVTALFDGHGAAAHLVVLLGRPAAGLAMCVAGQRRAARSNPAPEPAAEPMAVPAAV
ncbi:hypothetical protein AB0F81_27060 [Actinoplanes sp. NPDC024001]|uniref:hypothetical protein n=1 Tax=Actinoplanes sp. NPDC024001 TaxID=3154598 RepID=UPI0034026691